MLLQLQYTDPEGANGVVLITTKKGTSGKPKISTFLTNSVRTVIEKLMF